ncbi:MAG: TrbG/VirB9 family P-type conjugative transfer protein [Asticcacaulis sp.]
MLTLNGGRGPSDSYERTEPLVTAVTRNAASGSGGGGRNEPLGLYDPQARQGASGGDRFSRVQGLGPALSPGARSLANTRARVHGTVQMSRLALPFCFCSWPAWPQARPRPRPMRIRALRTIDYDESAVVQLSGCPNFQTMITFGDSEHVENVGLGDSSVWQVTPTSAATCCSSNPWPPRVFPT